MLTNTVIVTGTLTIEAVFFLALLANYFYNKKTQAARQLKADDMMVAFKVLAKSKLQRAMKQVQTNELVAAKEESKKWVLNELEDLKNRHLFTEKEYNDYKDEMAAYN